MVFTKEIPPSGALIPFVKSYSYREFDTGGIEVQKPWYASHESCLIFFFESLPHRLTDALTGKVIIEKANPCGFVSMTGACDKVMVFKGKYSFFQINLKPSGLVRLFGVPPTTVSDRILAGDELLGQNIRYLHEQLIEANTIEARAEIADTWLKCLLFKRTPEVDRITYASNILIHAQGTIPIHDLAKMVCMSTRNFERSFILDTGMSPRKMGNIIRFNYALELKRKNRQITWTSIAQKAGYFDQMHLIRDFKKFAGSTPFSLLNHNPLLLEKYTDG